jgi:hypothetical protein
MQRIEAKLDVHSDSQPDERATDQVRSALNDGPLTVHRTVTQHTVSNVNVI